VDIEIINSFTRSYLKTINLCRGDAVQKGTFLGLAGTNEEGNYQQVNFMLFKKDRRLPFKKTVEYICSKVYCEQTKDYIL
jgi:hypothetical protein